MIILSRLQSDGEGILPVGIPIHNFITCNEDAEGKVWVKYWDGKETRTMLVVESIGLIQKHMSEARHGTS